MTSPFCKSVDCPTSQQLSAFQIGRLDSDTHAGIRDHLEACEFCTAELEFYRAYPPQEETVVVGAIPEPLLELANALLRRDRDLTPLYRLVRNED